MISIALAWMAMNLGASSPYTCNQQATYKRPYGKVQLRVDCQYVSMGGMISVLEYKGDTQHGIAVHYDSLWRKRDSTFFENGKKNGLSLFWDTLGNVIGRVAYKGGKRIGREEFFWAPGKPSLVKNYNAQGEADGTWEEWWRNGNKKAAFIARNGDILSGTEYFPDGKLRRRFTRRLEPKRESFLDAKYVQGETWAPDGRATGKIVDGNGEWTHFSFEPDSLTGRYRAVHEVYKDSIMIGFKELDSAGVANWLKP